MEFACLLFFFPQIFIFGMLLNAVKLLCVHVLLKTLHNYIQNLTKEMFTYSRVTSSLSFRERAEDG